MMTVLSVALGVDFEGASEQNQFTRQQGSNQQPSSEPPPSAVPKKEQSSANAAKSKKEPEPMEIDENLTDEQKQVFNIIHARMYKEEYVTQAKTRATSIR